MRSTLKGFLTHEYLLSIVLNCIAKQWPALFQRLSKLWNLFSSTSCLFPKKLTAVFTGIDYFEVGPIWYDFVISFGFLGTITIYRWIYAIADKRNKYSLKVTFGGVSEDYGHLSRHRYIYFWSYIFLNAWEWKQLSEQSKSVDHWCCDRYSSFNILYYGVYFLHSSNRAGDR